MTKALFEKYINLYKDLDITSYVIKVEGGNRNIFVSPESYTHVVSETDGIRVYQRTINNNVGVDGSIDVLFITWDEVQSVNCFNLSIQQALDFAEEFGDDSDEFKEFISNIPLRQPQVTSDKGSVMGTVLKDDQGHTILPAGRAGMVI